MQPLQAWLLAALLLAAQALGLAHGVAHGLPQGPTPASVLTGAALAPTGQLAAGDVHAHAHAHAHAHEHAGSAAVGATSDVAGHQAGSADCRLIDQLAHADALCGSASLPTGQPRAAATSAAALLPALPAGNAAAYLARGPPAAALRRPSVRA